MWVNIVVCFLGTIAYGILFNVPVRALFGGGCIGLLGWFVTYLLPLLSVSPRLSILLASFLVATVSHLLARVLKMPSTNFIVAGIIPLVPGAKAYRTMRAFVEEDYYQGLALAIDTAFSAGAIAAGIMISLTIFFYRKGIGRQNETSYSGFHPQK